MAKEPKKPVAEEPPVVKGGGESEPAPKRKLVSNKMLIIAAVVVLQVVGSYFLQKTFFFPEVAGAKEAEAAAKKTEKKKTEETEKKVVMLDELVVNPAETGGRRYLAVTIGLQTGELEADKTVEKNKPLIRDALISLLSAKHLDELARISYRDTLKSEIKDAMNKQMGEKFVDTVVFSGYVLQ